MRVILTFCRIYYYWESELLLLIIGLMEGNLNDISWTYNLKYPLQPDINPVDS
jgi:hypothetical protein